MNRHSFLLLVYFLTAVSAAFFYFQSVFERKEALQRELYRESAAQLRLHFSNMLEQKKRSTLAIAIAMANDSEVVSMLKSKKVSTKRYENLLRELRRYTYYKNVWVQLVGLDGNTIYRNWSPRRGDFSIDNDLFRRAFLSKRAQVGVRAGKYGLYIDAFIPIADGDDTVGFFEVITHFNSIAAELKKERADAVIVATRNASKKVVHPFTNLFIGNLYVANYNANAALREYIAKSGLRHFSEQPTLVESDYLIVTQPIKEAKRVIAYAILFKRLSAITTENIDFFVYKSASLGVLLLVALLLVIAIIALYTARRQKRYYQNIIDSSSNILIISDGKSIIDVNSTFFNYFTMYDTLEAFKKYNNCICDFFVEEDGYLQKKYGKQMWTKHLAQEAKERKAKMKIDDRVYYFIVSATHISQELEHYAVIFVDITQEELFRRELERQSITDTLTGIKNRRYFNTALQTEINRAKRHNAALSLVMCDIDFFKTVNDVYGHDVGDKVLVEYTRLISASIRNEDIFCRIGGEEFIIIVPQIGADDATKMVNKLREIIEEHKKVVAITMSFGVTQMRSDDDFNTLFKRVDMALYKAKESGRNKVVVL